MALFDDFLSFADLTRFEDNFQKALEAASHEKRSTSTADSSVYMLDTDHGRYEFTIKRSARYGLPKKIEVSGPVFNRADKQTGQVGYLGVIDVANGKRNLSGSPSTKKHSGWAVDKFLHQHNAPTDLGDLGWTYNARPDGWAYVSKKIIAKSGPMAGRRINKEVALLAADVPGASIVEFTVDGKRRLTYDERQKLKIPHVIYEALRKEFHELMHFYMIPAWTKTGGSGKVHLNAWLVSDSGMKDAPGTPEEMSHRRAQAEALHESLSKRPRR
jgi:hypothetical protein